MLLVAGYSVGNTNGDWQQVFLTIKNWSAIGAFHESQ